MGTGEHSSAGRNGHAVNRWGRHYRNPPACRPTGVSSSL
ncbi:Uncharacterised protein [Vibrio cholerae]|nr:Uncharacterised protein [Vibrio cholerae]